VSRLVPCFLRLYGCRVRPVSLFASLSQSEQYSNDRRRNLSPGIRLCAPCIRYSQLISPRSIHLFPGGRFVLLQWPHNIYHFTRGRKRYYELTSTEAKISKQGNRLYAITLVSVVLHIFGLVWNGFLASSTPKTSTITSRTFSSVQMRASLGRENSITFGDVVTLLPPMSNAPTKLQKRSSLISHRPSFPHICVSSQLVLLPYCFLSRPVPPFASLSQSVQYSTDYWTDLSPETSRCVCCVLLPQSIAPQWFS
jgi:hypothetical protein